MREIKFRGKRIYNGEWVEGSLCQGENRIFIVYDNDFTVSTIYGETNLISDRFFEVDPDMIGQYTGLKDKHGTEIYEGDIIDCGFGDGNTVVYFDEKTCQFTTEQRWLWGYDKIEVLGNIYDNPELIKEG